MRIQIVKLVAGPQGVYRPGDIVNVDTEAAEILIGDGAARRIGKHEVREVAALRTQKQSVVAPTSRRTVGVK